VRVDRWYSAGWNDREVVIDSWQDRCQWDGW
jgi:hypothetical protein